MTTTTDAVVRLDPYEFLFAAQVGLARRVRNSMRQSLDRYGFDQHAAAWGIDIDSACAEFAVAKFLDRFWSGPTSRLADVSTCVQVRQTRHDGGHLFVHQHDRDEDQYVLAVGSDGLFRLIGWVRGAEAKQPVWWTATRPDAWCYKLPQSALHGMDELQEIWRGVPARYPYA